jgi:hypothetical protein
MAWLAATPEHRGKGEPDTRSRAQRYKDRDGQDSPRLALPDVGPAEYLVGYLFEVGPLVGGHELTFAHLEPWARATGVDLDEFKAVLLVELSRVYLSMANEARATDCPPPYRVRKEK